MTRLVIIGAGGHGRVVADCARAMRVFDDIVFIDNSYPDRKQNLDWPIVANTADWTQFSKTSTFFVAIGDNNARLNWLSILIDAKVPIANIIHPSSVCSPSIEIGLGNCIFANAVINPAVHIGNGCIINTGATVDHDCKLGHGVHISPGANLAGQVQIEEGTWVGIGANVIQCTNITRNAIIGAGASVVSDIEESGTYVGVPAKKIK